MRLADAVGRGLSAAGQGLTQIGMTKLQAELQAKRDAKLNEYSIQQMGAQQAFTAEQNELDRTARATESQADREARAEENRLDREQQQRNLDLQADELLGRISNNTLQNKLKQMEFDSEQNLRDAMDVIADASKSFEERQAAINYINLRNKESRYTLQSSDFGFALLDNLTGRVEVYETDDPGVYGQTGKGSTAFQNRGSRPPKLTGNGPIRLADGRTLKRSEIHIVRTREDIQRLDDGDWFMTDPNDRSSLRQRKSIDQLGD